MKRKNREEGTALIATLMFLMAMGILSTALVFTVQNDMKTSTSYKYGQQSFYQAQAAVQDAVQWFRDTYTPYMDANICADCSLSTYPVEWQGDPVVLEGKTNADSNYPIQAIIDAFEPRFSGVTLAANATNSGQYRVNATLLKHWFGAGAFIDPVTLAISDGSVQRWRLNVVGYWGTAAKPLGISQITAVIENTGAAFFDRALWGKDEVILSGNEIIDSYDPTLGLWDPDTNSGYNGAIGTNGVLDISNNASVHGDVAWGPNGSYNGGGTITGDRLQLPQERVFNSIPDFEVGTVNKTVNPSDSDTILNGENNNKWKRIRVQGSLTFEPGTYWIDELEMTANGAIYISGDTRLYVKKSLSIAGQGVMNAGGNPSQLSIFYTGQKADFTGGGTAYVQLYAPDASLKITGNTDFSGSFIAESIKVSGGARIHYSDGCLKKNLVRQPFRLITWSQDSF